MTPGQGLAQKFTTGELSADLLLRASNEEVMERLTQVRGLGRWSAEVRLRIPIIELSSGKATHALVLGCA